MILMTLICQPTVYGAWTAVIFFDRPLAKGGNNFKSAFRKQHVHPKEDMAVLGKDFVEG